MTTPLRTLFGRPAALWAGGDRGPGPALRHRLAMGAVVALAALATGGALAEDATSLPTKDEIVETLTRQMRAAAAGATRGVDAAAEAGAAAADQGEAGLDALTDTIDALINDTVTSDSATAPAPADLAPADLAGAIATAAATRAAVSPDQEREAATMINGFGRRLLGEVIAENPPANPVVSPVSVASALLMTAVGTAGPTRAAFAATLGVEGQAIDGAAAGAGALVAALTDTGNQTEVAIANAVWGDHTLEFRPAYLDTLSAQFGAEARSIDFADPGAAAEINGWVATATRDKITQLVAPPLAGTLVALLNATYFKGIWLDPFDPAATAPQPFTRTDGTAVEVAMMRRDAAALPYLETEAVRAVLLTYAGGFYEMVLALPAPGGSVAGLLDGAGAAWQDRGRYHDRPGLLVLPRLDLEAAFELKPALSALGLGPAFAAADLSGMVGDDQAAELSSVLHKIALTVDEEGTEAAAATAVMVSRSFSSVATEPFELVLDRPFLVGLRHVATDTLLFLGAIADPTG